MNLTRRLAARFFDPRGDDVSEVVAEFPANLSDAGAIAVLAWTASRQERMTLDEFLDRVRTAANGYFVAPSPAASTLVGGRPAKNWEAEYGKSAQDIEFGAVVRRAARSSPTMAAARGASLEAARVSAGLGKRSSAAIAKDAARLKLAVRKRGGKPAPE